MYVIARLLRGGNIFSLPSIPSLATSHQVLRSRTLPLHLWDAFSLARTITSIFHRSIFTMASIVSLALAFIVAVASADGKTTTCYGYNGEPFENNTVCPGSNACCGAQATCLSNRLCHNPNDGPNTFVRGPCSVESYDSGTCAQICLYSNSISTPYSVHVD